MQTDKSINDFLSNYSDEVFRCSIKLRELLIKSLPDIIEQMDLPAKMIAYCYGQKYSEMICTIIPSKKGLKLGFYKGADLSDPNGLLQGTGKISRYFEIKSEQQINSAALKKLLATALTAYKQRMKK